MVQKLPAFVQVFLDVDKVDTSLHSLLSAPYFQSSWNQVRSKNAPVQVTTPSQDSHTHTRARTQLRFPELT